jgi:hypothetical protein
VAAPEPGAGECISIIGGKAMGLDITAASKIVLLEAGKDSDPSDEIWSEYQARGIETVRLYGADFPQRTDGLVDGIYRVDGEVFKFHAGSYSGYNWWRNELSKFAWGRYAYDENYRLGDKRRYTVTKADQERPFYCLINMSDAEGAIGPKTSAMLAYDFQQFRAKADELADCGDYGFTTKYHEWQQAFELAMDSGVVIFH